MIFKRLFVIKEETLARIAAEQKQLETILTIQEILSQVDWSVEYPNVSTTEELIEFINSLGGRSLTGEEIKIADRLVKDVKNRQRKTNLQQ